MYRLLEFITPSVLPARRSTFADGRRQRDQHPLLRPEPTLRRLWQRPARHSVWGCVRQLTKEANFPGSAPGAQGAADPRLPRGGEMAGETVPERGTVPTWPLPSRTQRPPALSLRAPARSPPPPTTDIHSTHTLYTDTPHTHTTHTHKLYTQTHRHTRDTYRHRYHTHRHTHHTHYTHRYTSYTYYTHTQTHTPHRHTQTTHTHPLYLEAEREELLF